MELPRNKITLPTRTGYSLKQMASPWAPPPLAQKHKLVNYFCYVDDILLIYDAQHTDIHTILSNFNSIHPNLQFTKETEHSNKLNYLDIMIHKTPTSVNIGVFRKPTFTDIIIPYTSNHPTHHKYAAIRFLYSRLNSYQLHETECHLEENIIHNILHNSSPIPTWKPKTWFDLPSHNTLTGQKCPPSHTQAQRLPTLKNYLNTQN